MEAVAQLDLPFISEMFGQNGFGITHGDLTPITWDMAKKKNCARLKSPNIYLHKPPNVYPRGGMKPSTKHFVKAVLESSSFTVVYGCDICEVINHHKSRCPPRSCRQGADIPMCFLLRRGKSYAFIADHKL